MSNKDIINRFGSKTIEWPIIPDAIEVLSGDKNAIKFTDKKEFDLFLAKQKYFSASYSHCYYSMKDLKLSHKGDKRFRNGSTGTSESDRGCVMLKNTGDLVAVWSQRDKVGYIIPAKIRESKLITKSELKQLIKEEINLVIESNQQKKFHDKTQIVVSEINKLSKMLANKYL